MKTIFTEMNTVTAKQDVSFTFLKWLMLNAWPQGTKYSLTGVHHWAVLVSTQFKTACYTGAQR